MMVMVMVMIMMLMMLLNDVDFFEINLAYSKMSLPTLKECGEEFIKDRSF